MKKPSKKRWRPKKKKRQVKRESVKYESVKFYRFTVREEDQQEKVKAAYPAAAATNYVAAVRKGTVGMPRRVVVTDAAGHHHRYVVIDEGKVCQAIGDNLKSIKEAIDGARPGPAHVLLTTDTLEGAAPLLQDGDKITYVEHKEKYSLYQIDSDGLTYLEGIDREEIRNKWASIRH